VSRCLRTIVFTIAFLIGPMLASAAVRPVEGTLVMARGGAQPLYLWNATNYVAHLVTDKLLGTDGMRALEASALQALVEKISGNTAKVVSLRVVYAKTGAVSPAYGTPTFAGMENVLTVTADRQSLLKHVASWQANIASGRTPAGVRIEVSGALPPQ
jgi:hypothetical protein